VFVCSGLHDAIPAPVVTFVYLLNLCESKTGSNLHEMRDMT